MPSPIRPRLRFATIGPLPLAFAVIFGAGDTAAHGHPAAIDPASPDAWRYRLCEQMSSVALQALRDREHGLPMRVFPEDGGPGPAIAKAIVEKVYAEPGISSPKRAEAFGRGYCNEHLDN
ncbi:hypothetical protein [Sulfurisoma sediminicola]|uniref:Uncharacterized protein n=1 Tax=Sulfurisoma sediminicola TaxID=1381557 RepID=A0A497X935_9PROT|nr:hypothetical protein [Sulfurisoma sediminicola]RLJ62752.1 hypothetical protein DFR35_2568 [Sulfurisoma sediminicola]